MLQILKFCCCSVAQSCPTVCNPVDCSMPGFPILLCLSELAQTHVHWLSQWCHPAIPSSVIPFSCLQSFPASGSFLMSRLFASGGQSIGVSASGRPVNIWGWFPLGFIALISLLSKGLSRVFSNTSSKASIFSTQPSLWSNSHIHTWMLENQ